jgi:hypothetical protein
MERQILVSKLHPKSTWSFGKEKKVKGVNIQTLFSCDLDIHHHLSLDKCNQNPVIRLLPPNHFAGVKGIQQILGYKMKINASSMYSCNGVGTINKKCSAI